ncbi:MAG: zinc-binding dehydrogenase [Dehalococcoidia bacterium]
MKAAVFHGKGDFRVEDVDDASPGEGQVLVRVDYCGICGSDLHMVESDLLPVPPEGIVLGHEFAGEIVDVGAGVPPSRKGEGVAVVPALFCGECQFCRGGRMMLCRNQTPTIGLGVMRGALAERVAVDARTAIPLDGVSARDGALAEPLAVAHHGVGLADLEAGQSVLVTGCGPIGALVIQVLKALGHERIIASEPSAFRRQLALRLGAMEAVDPVQQDLTAAVQKEAGPLGVDVVFECTGLPLVIGQALSLLRPAGTMVVLGVGMEPAPISPLMLVVNEHTIKGALGYSDLFTSSLQLLRDGVIDVDAVISTTRPLEEVGATFRDLASNPSLCKVLIAPH